MLGKINWKPSRKDMLYFGLVLIVGFGAIGAFLYKAGRTQTALWIWSLSGGVGLLAVLLPPLAKPFYWLWMGLGFVVGSIMSRLVILIIFYGIITPVALLFKIKGRDALNRKRKPSATETYWQEHIKIADKSYYEHLF